jgi:DNA-binding NarL/FixJ family response regulator
VVRSHYAEPGHVLALLESGSDGRAYLLKDRVHDHAQLVAAIGAVAAGGSVLDGEIVESLLAAKLHVEQSPLAALTAREREVLAEIATGKSNAVIADMLILTQRAVEKHINSISLKLDLAFAEVLSFSRPLHDGVQGRRFCKRSAPWRRRSRGAQMPS